jgi:hypothetical protein
MDLEDLSTQAASPSSSSNSSQSFNSTSTSTQFYLSSSTGINETADSNDNNDESAPKRMKSTKPSSYLKSLKIDPKTMSSNELAAYYSAISASNSSSQSTNIYLVHKRLEERIGGILCCTVCLDLPLTPIYQVRY